MALGYLKEPGKCPYPFSADGESNLPEYFCRGNVFQTMTPLEAVKSTAMKTKCIAEPKSASSENSSYAKKSLLMVHPHQPVQPAFENSTEDPKAKKNHMNSFHVLASGVIKDIPLWL